MKCIDKKQRKKQYTKGILGVFLLSAVLTGCSLIKHDPVVEEYELKTYNQSMYRIPSLFADELCVASENVALSGAPAVDGIGAAALFDLNEKKVNFSYDMHKRLYPASTTKILTALVAIKNGNLDDMVTVGAESVDFAADEQICGLKAGDRLTLRDLLYGLILQSGNDSAEAIARHISGSIEGFADMMNAQAQELMATNSHFENPSGLHSANHYTTAYDLYLIYNECMKNPEFMELNNAQSYQAAITQADGQVRNDIWEPTNYYAQGLAAPPTNATVKGGKTGTTDEAGNCLILLEETTDGKPYVSVIMKADTKALLYEDMTAMIQTIPN